TECGRWVIRAPTGDPVGPRVDVAAVVEPKAVCRTAFVAGNKQQTYKCRRYPDKPPTVAQAVRLLNRTTRRLALTDEGAVYYERCRPAIEELHAAAAASIGLY